MIERTFQAIRAFATLKFPVETPNSGAKGTERGKGRCLAYRTHKYRAFFAERHAVRLTARAENCEAAHVGHEIEFAQHFFVASRVAFHVPCTHLAAGVVLV